MLRLVLALARGGKASIGVWLALLVVVVKNCKAEVSKLHMKLFIKENVHWFQVSVDETTLVVEVVESLNDLYKDLPLEVLLLSSLVVINERSEGVALAVLHLNVKNSDLPLDLLFLLALLFLDTGIVRTL